jgi:hypothetical protein
VVYVCGGWVGHGSARERSRVRASRASRASKALRALWKDANALLSDVASDAEVRFFKEKDTHTKNRCRLDLLGLVARPDRSGRETSRGWFERAGSRARSGPDARRAFATSPRARVRDAP